VVSADHRRRRAGRAHCTDPRRRRRGQMGRRSARRPRHRRRARGEHVVRRMVGPEPRPASPDRVCSVVGVEPVWRRLGIRTMARGVTVLAAAAAPAPICRWAADRLHQPFLWDPRLGRVGRLAYTRFANGHPDPSASPTSSWPGSTAPSRACSARAARSPHRESCAVA
jgi:hypothetical protein